MKVVSDHLEALTPDAVAHFSLFSREGIRRWERCLGCADYLWNSLRSDHASMAWHHLLMTVGNFKRQSPISPPNEHWVPDADEHKERPPVLELPFGLHISCEDPDSWKAIEDVKGIGVSTASAVLAALWPRRHAIIDQRALGAAVGLLGCKGRWVLGANPESSDAVAVTWDAYEQYRAWVLATADRLGEGSPIRVERCLYKLDRQVGEGEGRNWAQYVAALQELLASTSSMADQPEGGNLPGKD